MGFQEPPEDEKLEFSESTRRGTEVRRTSWRLTIVVSDHRLQLLFSIDGSLLGIRDNVEHSDSIESDHLLEIDVASFVSVGVLDREGVVLMEEGRRKGRFSSARRDEGRGTETVQKLTVPFEFD